MVEKVGALIKGCWCPYICCQLWKGGCETHCVQPWLASGPAYSGISGQWPRTVGWMAPGPGIRELSFLCLIDISHRISFFMYNPNPCRELGGGWVAEAEITTDSELWTPGVRRKCPFPTQLSNICIYFVMHIWQEMDSLVCPWREITL